MKHINYLSLLLVMIAFLFLIPSDAYGKNNSPRYKPGHHNHNSGNNDNNEHNNNSPERRYKYNGQEYSFPEYYRIYSVEDNLFTYQGAYGRYGDIFIFTDKYGNEFDLYIKPVERISRWFKGYSIREGDAYYLRLKQTRLYPRTEDIQLGINFSFGWGNLSLQNNQYFDLYTAPELVNVRGQLYFKSRH